LTISEHDAQLGTGPTAPTLAAAARLRPVQDGGFRFRDGFWAIRQRLVRERSLPHAIRSLADAGNIDNLRRLAGEAPGVYRGRGDSDSNVYKVMEAMAWDLGAEPSPSLEAELSSLVAVVRQVQDGDGYVNSWFQSRGAAARYSDLAMGHEMYCAGHLIQAAVARLRATGSDDLLCVAVRFADHLVETFGEGGRPGICGHPLIETALVELYRTTGATRYLELAMLMLDRRGHGLLSAGLFGNRYYQDDIPVRDAGTLRGHCVRALYLATGAADVYLETGEERLLAALVTQWDDMVATKTYLTGGLGCRRKDEAFGAAFELPPDQAFAETCAAVGAVTWSWRLLLATGNSRYADLIERILFNVIAAALSLDGQQFFYTNTLHRRPGSPETGDKVTLRRPWFRCACCPPNLMRLVASLGFYVATTTRDGLQIHQYADGRVRCALGDGDGVLELDIRTDYPWSGVVTVTVVEEPGVPCAVAFRRPDWCESVDLRVDGRAHPAVADERGYVAITRRWQPGEQIVVDLAMPARFTRPDRHVDAVRGCVAVERGPLVYCLEQADLPDALVVDVAIDVDQSPDVVSVPEFGADTLALRARGFRLLNERRRWPYVSADSSQPPDTEPTALTLVPYHAWGNRVDGEMRVWLPRV
jgi:DUF1680 family protein